MEEGRDEPWVGLSWVFCELNFIESFWGWVKKYLRDCCDYTVETLKVNLPKAMESVPLHTIRRWEHRRLSAQRSTKVAVIADPHHTCCLLQRVAKEFECRIRSTTKHGGLRNWLVRYHNSFLSHTLFMALFRAHSL